MLKRSTRKHKVHGRVRVGQDGAFRGQTVPTVQGLHRFAFVLHLNHATAQAQTVLHETR